jgi:hypothetical protein
MVSTESSISTTTGTKMASSIVKKTSALRLLKSIKTEKIDWFTEV